MCVSVCSDLGMSFWCAIWSFLRVRMRASIFWSVTAWVCEILPSCVCLVLSKETGVCVRFYVCVCVVVVVHRCQIFSHTVLQSAVSLSLSSHVPLLNNAVGGDGHSYIIISL